MSKDLLPSDFLTRIGGLERAVARQERSRSLPYVIDSSGGLLGVMNLLGSADMSPQNQSFTTADGATYIDMGVSVSITLSRRARLLLPWTAPVRVTAGTFFAYMTANVFDSSLSLIGSADGGLIADSRNGGYVSFYAAGSATLNAGSYTVKMQVATDTGLTLGVRSVHLDVYQLGTSVS
jgi:hypothetical protein